MSDSEGADRYILVLKRRFNARTDEQLAAALGVSKKTISSWRSRGRVPFSVQAQAMLSAADIYQPAASGSAQHEESLRLVRMAIFLYLHDRYRDLLNADSRGDALLYWAEEYPQICARTALALSEFDLSQATPSDVVSSLIARTEAGEIFSFRDIFDYHGSGKK